MAGRLGIQVQRCENLRNVSGSHRDIQCDQGRIYGLREETRMQTKLRPPKREVRCATPRPPRVAASISVRRPGLPGAVFEDSVPLSGVASANSFGNVLFA